MLLKGCHKRTICVKSADSRLFCEAFFVLRDEQTDAHEADMLAEANRILEDSLSPRRRRRRGLPPLYAFLFGLLTASLLWLVVLLLVLL